MKTIRIATRQSQLALWQAEHVKALLQSLHPDLQVQLIPMTTQGDELLETRLDKVGGKGLFVKELEHALLNQTADIAVHSMKDVPVEYPEGLHLPVILTREDPRDALVANHATTLATIKTGAIIGTSSLRRESQLKLCRPDLNVKLLRGNVPTRLAKLDRGEYDAIILAAAGLNRLEQSARITHYLSLQESVPAAGQGAIGIECRVDDVMTQQFIAPLHDANTAECVIAERALNRRIAEVLPAAKSICHVPIAAHALRHAHGLELIGLVATTDGSQCLRETLTDPSLSPTELGQALANRLLEQGALEILLA